jgi:hypothetical protein
MHTHTAIALAAVAAALADAPALAQTAATAPVKGATVKATQPGLFDVAGPRVQEVAASGIRKIVATPGKGARSIEVQSPWGWSYFGWPQGVKPVAFTITMSGSETATISAPGFTKANQGDYKAAIDSIVPFAIDSTAQNRKWMQGSGR